MDLRRLVGSVNQLRFNDNRGEVSFFGQKMIIMRRDVFRVMREGLERLVGEQAAPFLSFLASGIGIHEGSIFRESAKSGGENERASLENLVHTAFEDTNLGLGKIKVNKLNFDEAQADVVIANCFEALENGPSEGPNCMFTGGFLAGLFAEVFDKTVQADEMHCISQGHAECEFQITPAEKVEMPDGGEVEVVALTTVAPSEGGTGKLLEGSKDGKGLTESKPVASETVKTGKESAPAGPKKGSERDLDAGVEKAARIAKRKQGFWERLFKK
jgi:predicted hydrocarbon binding protein